MTGSAFVIGESLVDIVTAAGGGCTEVVGGSPANVALGLARQGVPVRLRTALGRDARGERIAAHLGASGVVVDERSWSLASTSTAHAQIRADGSAEYAFDVTWVLSADADPIAEGLVHVGSIAAFLDPGAAEVEALLDRLAPDILVSFDPNIRPALLGDPGAARRRFARIAARADVVKLSDEDAAWLHPGLPAEAACAAVLAAGPRLVALTLGGDGALLCAADLRVEVPAPTVTVVDTVGAGDTFMAALIHEMLADPDLVGAPTAAALASAGAYAVAAAALTVQRVGADLPTAARIREARG